MEIPIELIQNFFNKIKVDDANKTINEQLIEVLAKNRLEIDNIIFNYAERLKNFIGIRDLQSEIISTRQRLLENNHTVLDKITELNYKLIKLKSAELIKINTSYNIRFQNASERDMVIKSNDVINESAQRIEILTNFSLYLKDSMSLLDDMKFAVRNIIDINSMLGAVPK